MSDSEGRAVDPETPGEATVDAEPELSPVRLLLGAILIGAAYLALPWLMNGGASVSGWLLAAAALGGAAIGVVVASAQVRRPAAGRRRGRHRAPSTAGFIAGTTGASLLLGRVLDQSSVPWVLLVCVALVTGLVGHTVRERSCHRGQASAVLPPDEEVTS